MDVLVAGAGSLGSLLGGLLAREHDVTLVGRAPHVRAIRESGLRIDGAVEAHVRPRATTDVGGLDADLALVAVKAYDTATVARQLAGEGGTAARVDGAGAGDDGAVAGDDDGSASADAEPASVDAVLSVQNGLGNEETLAEHVDVPVLAGTATYGARLVEPGRVTCTGLGEVVLGPREGASDGSIGSDGSNASGASDAADGSPACDRAEAVATAFRDAGIDASAVDDPSRRLWKKLAVNAGINPVTALARVENGALRSESDPAGAIAREAARETARVATACGVDLSPADAVAALDAVVESTAANRSSMLQDVAAGQRTEVDAVLGAVVERAEREGVAVPVTRTLAALLEAWERGQGLR